MALKKIMFRVLLSSPSDVEIERNHITEIISEINDANKDTPFGIELFKWEADVSPDLKGHDGQVDIDKTFDYKHADLLIGLFYKKLGKGTIHEIDEALEIRKHYGLPEIKLFFKERNEDLGPLSEEDLKQIKEFNDKKNEYMKLGIVGKYTCPSDFVGICRKEVMKFFNNAKSAFVREQYISSLQCQFIPQDKVTKVNAYKMCFFRNETAKLTIKELAKKAKISERKIKKYEKMVYTSGKFEFPECPSIDLLKIEEVLGVNRGGLSISTDDIKNIEYKEYYKQNKGLISLSNKCIVKHNVVVFDFDGTLADANVKRTTWQRLWEKLGYKLSLCSDLHEQFDAKQITHQEWCDKTAEYFIKGGLNINTLVEISKDITLVEGFVETIEQLKNNNVKMYIVSGSVTDVIKSVLGKYTNYFEDISANEFIFDDGGTLKYIKGTEFDFEGKAAYIRRLVDNNEIPPKQILFVGNSFNDAHVYLSGCSTLCVNPQQTNSHNKKYWHYSIDDMKNLTEILSYIL